MPEPADFWSFSLGLYARPGLPDLLLRLQDTQGADVNLLLFVLWRARLGQRFDADLLADVAAAAEPWRRGVRVPLRPAPPAAKPLAEGSPSRSALRETLKSAELEAERLAQVAMDATPEGIPAASPAEAARAGLLACAPCLNGPDLAVLLGTVASCEIQQHGPRPA